MKPAFHLAGCPVRVLLTLIAGSFVVAASAATPPFTYRRGGIPDLDQTRQAAGGQFGLPNNGINHCVPTSAMDCLAYIANHGYGWMEPNGYRNWQDQSFYGAATLEIYKMGYFFMSTDPNTGTTGANHVQGVKDWFDSWNLLSDFTVVGQFASGTSCPTPNDLADAAAQGAIIMPIVGWYSVSGGAYTRSGGHCLAMNKIVGNTDGTYKISWRDPAADEGDLTKQSPFATETYSLSAVTASFDGNTRTQYRVASFASGGNPGFLDGFVAITPKYALTSAPGDFELDLLNFSQLVGAQTHHVVVPGGVADAAFHAGMGHVAYLTQPADGYSELRVLDPVSGGATVIQQSIYGVLKVAVSRQRRAYVLESGGISVQGYDLDQHWDPYVAQMPQYMNTLAYDDLNDFLYVLCTANTRLLRCPPDLSAQNDVQLPGGLSINPSAPMAVSPVTGNVLIASQWASEFYELGIDQNGVATLLSNFYDSNLYDAIGISVDDRNHVFVSTNRGIGLEFAGGAGNWYRVTPSALDGHTFGKVIAMTYSRSNFDPATMLGPGYHNVLPTDFAPSVYDNAPSDFEQGDDGWQVVGFNSYYPPPPFGGIAPIWNPTGGNPGAAIETTDQYPETFFSAPDQFLGDKTGFYGGTLMFDMLINYSDFAAYPAVILAGNGEYLYYNADPTDQYAWTTRSIPLTEDGWRYNDWQGPAVSAAIMQRVLADLQGLYINAEWHTGPDDTLLDNVYLNPPATACVGDLNCDGSVDFADIDPFVLSLSGESAYLAQFPNCRWLNGDANGDGTVDFADIDAFVGLLFTACP